MRPRAGSRAFTWIAWGRLYTTCSLVTLTTCRGVCCCLERVAACTLPNCEAALALVQTSATKGEVILSCASEIIRNLDLASNRRAAAACAKERAEMAATLAHDSISSGRRATDVFRFLKQQLSLKSHTFYDTYYAECASAYNELTTLADAAEVAASDACAVLADAEHQYGVATRPNKQSQKAYERANQLGWSRKVDAEHAAALLRSQKLAAASLSSTSDTTPSTARGQVHHVVSLPPPAFLAASRLQSVSVQLTAGPTGYVDTIITHATGPSQQNPSSSAHNRTSDSALVEPSSIHATASGKGTRLPVRLTSEWRRR